MRRLPLFLLALTLLATPSHAGGINLAWNDCGSFGSATRTFACNTNTGVEHLYTSFVPSVTTPQLFVVRYEIFIDTNQATLSPWWDFGGSGHCHLNGLGGNADFTLGPFSCADPWQGGLVVGSAPFYYYQYLGIPNRARIAVGLVAASPLGVPPLTGGTEYYANDVVFTHQRSTGTGACAGCTDGACLVLQYVQLQGEGGAQIEMLLNPLFGQSVTWQTGAPSCPGATAARTPTWGQVKSLYR
jgi:hypothetical protein